MSLTPVDQPAAAAHVARAARMLLCAVVAVMVALSPFAAAPAGASGTGNFSLQHYVRYQNVNHQSVQIASGDTFRYVVNYTCSDANCPGGTLSIPFPAGFTLANPTYNPAHLPGLVRTGNELVFTVAANLPPGTTGQIDMEASTAAFTTPDGLPLVSQAALSSDGRPDVLSETVSVTIRAASTTTASVMLTAGGAVDDIARYRVSACSLSTGQAGVGPLGVQGNSTLSLQLPDGAEVVEVGGSGVLGSGGAISWTLDPINWHMCVDRDLIVRYPSSDPANTLGAAKQLVATWEREMVGQGAVTVSGSLDRTLSAPTAVMPTWLHQETPYSYGDAPSAKVDFGLAIIHRADVLNTGTATVQAVVELDLPVALRPTTILASNPSRSSATVHIRSTCGPDRTPGTGDDDDWEPVATLAAGADVSVDPLVGFPDGSTPLPPGCTVVAVRLVVDELWPGDGTSQALRVTSTPTDPDREGSPTAHGDVLSTDLVGTATNTGGTSSLTRNALAAIAPPPEPPPVDPNHYATVRANGPGTLGFGVTEGDASVTFWPGIWPFPPEQNPLIDPVVAVYLPANVSLVSWSMDAPSGTSTPELEQRNDYDGEGGTILVWTFPAGTSLTAGTGVTINFRVGINEFSYGNLTMPAYVDSAAHPLFCSDNFFGAQPDQYDVDGDGITAETGCRWDAPMGVVASASASVVMSIRGAFDPDFVAGPATGQTAPGSSDDYRVALRNSGTTELDQLVVVQKLPRPGDTMTLSGSARNPSSGTFPVVLRAVPTVPDLPLPVELAWSDLTGACQPELGYNPSGCVDPQWRSFVDEPPADLAEVTMIKFDFGDNVLKPGFSWTVQVPVTTPTDGATEPDRADVNPDPVNLANEYAVATAAVRGQRKDISSALAAAEPPGVTLEVPGALGPVGPVPDPGPISTSGIGTATQTATAAPPPGGSVHLLDDDGDPVDELVVAGVGTYRVVPATGELSFEPELGYAGTATAVGYRVTDAYGQSGDSTWTATVAAPAPPAPGALQSSAPVRTTQRVTPAVPTGATLHLLDGTTPVSTLVLDGVGTWKVVGSEIEFEPEPTFAGTAGPVPFRVTDPWGQHGDGTHVATVSLSPLAASPIAMSGVGPAVQRWTIQVPEGTTARLLDGDLPVTELVVDGRGTFRIDPDTHELTFEPEPGWAGTTDPIAYELTDEFGQRAVSTITSTVVAPAPPPAGAQRTRGAPGDRSPQSVTIEVPSGATIELLDHLGRPTDRVVVPGQGVYELDAATGTITFTPEAGFVGVARAVQYRVTDAYGQPAIGTYQAEVLGEGASGAPPGPPAAPGLAGPVDGDGDTVTVAAPDPGAHTPASLAFTGSSLQLLVAAIALFAVGAGLTLAGRRPQLSRPG